MPAWATVVLTLGASAIAVLGTLAATLLQVRHARGQAERDAASARRSRAGQVLGRVRTLLADIEPDRIVINLHPDRTPRDLAAIEARWAPLRDELSIFAAADESPDVTADAAKLEVAVGNTLNRLGWEVQDRLTHVHSKETLEQARTEWTLANILIRIMLDRVRGVDVAELQARVDQISAERDAG